MQNQSINITDPAALRAFPPSSGSLPHFFLSVRAWFKIDTNVKLNRRKFSMIVKLFIGIITNALRDRRWESMNQEVLTCVTLHIATCQYR